MKVKETKFKTNIINLSGVHDLVCGCRGVVFSFFIINFFFQFHTSILDWLGNKFHYLFYFTFYELIITSKKYMILDWCSILWSCIFIIICLIKNNFKKQVINPNEGGFNFPFFLLIFFLISSFDIGLIRNWFS
jgi:hypothetical protein